MPFVIRPGATVRSPLGASGGVVGTGDFSMSCWVYVDSRFNSTAKSFAQVGDSAAAPGTGAWFQTQIVNQSAGTFAFEFGRSTSGAGLYSGAGLTMDRWLHIAVSHVGAVAESLPAQYTYSMGLDPDGVLVSRGSMGIFFPPAGVAVNPGTVGWALGSDGFGGALAHLQAWTRILSQAELQAAMLRPGSVRSGQTIWVPCDRTGVERVSRFHGSARGAVRRMLG